MTVTEFAFDQEIGIFLATCRTLSLATNDPSGHPHACNIQYAVNEKLEMFWVSSPNSEHSQNIQTNPHAAATIYGHDDRAQNIHGLQIRGTVESLSDPADCNVAYELYTSRFAFVAALPQFQDILSHSTFYRMKPTWMRWIDNRRGFGWKVEKELGEG